MHDILTNTEDVEAESVVDGLVDQLVRHAVEADMACQRDSTSTFTLKTQEIIIKYQLNNYQSLTTVCIDLPY